jgi:thymidylate kinase
MYQVVIFTPLSNADAVRNALAEAGGGAAGAYDSCSFTSVGEGRFRPLPGARPAIGTVLELAVVPEARIETTVSSEALVRVLKAVRAVHCYEQPAILVSQVLDYKMLLCEDPSPPPLVTTIEGQATTTPSLPVPRMGCSIAIEGLDGVGKSTLVSALAARLEAQVLRSPPDFMRPCRPFFDRADEATRKGYYMVGNFLAGESAAALVQAGGKVILDRFYASTLSYRFGMSSSPLPAPGDAAYSWPPELHAPTFMVLLTLPQADRIARRSGRLEVPETPEEAVLRLDDDVSERINEAYRRFGCVEVPLTTGDSVDAVVDKVLAACPGAWRKQ